MAKKDQGLNENIDRGARKGEGSGAIDSGNNNDNDIAKTNPGTIIKNANASGLGSMGRNDQEQTESAPNHEAGKTSE